MNEKMNTYHSHRTVFIHFTKRHCTETYVGNLESTVTKEVVVNAPSAGHFTDPMITWN